MTKILFLCVKPSRQQKHKRHIIHNTFGKAIGICGWLIGKWSTSPTFWFTAKWPLFL